MAFSSGMASVFPKKRVTVEMRMRSILMERCILIDGAIDQSV
jgi:hypothetical protein